MVVYCLLTFTLMVLRENNLVLLVIRLLHVRYDDDLIQSYSAHANTDLDVLFVVISLMIATDVTQCINFPLYILKLQRIFSICCKVFQFLKLLFRGLM